MTSKLACYVQGSKMLRHHREAQLFKLTFKVCFWQYSVISVILCQLILLPTPKISGDIVFPYSMPMTCKKISIFWLDFACITVLTLKPEYSGVTRSLPWLLKDLLFLLSCHQQPCALTTLCMLGTFWSSMRKDFIYLCHLNAEEWIKIKIHFAQKRMNIFAVDIIPYYSGLFIIRLKRISWHRKWLVMPMDPRC